MVAWSWDQVLARRLQRSCLLAREDDDPVEVARSVCGLQAQVPTAAELAIGIRTEGLTRARLRQVVEEKRQLVRTYAMRNTAHLLPGDQLPLYLSAMRQLYGGEDRWFTAFGLEAARADEVFRAIHEALDDRRLTRQELAAALRDRLGDWVFELFDPLLSELSVVAAYAGVLANGPSTGGRSTFVRPDQWVGQWEEVEGERALRVLVGSFFAAYGPATDGDLARWLGIRVGQARHLVEALDDELASVDVAGQAAKLPAAEVDSDYGTARGIIRLLPQYDCYVLGSGPVDQVAPPSVKDLIRKRKRGRYEGAAGVPVLLIDGMVAGVWERRLVGHRIHISVRPVRPLTVSERHRVEHEAERVARFDEAHAVVAIL